MVPDKKDARNEEKISGKNKEIADLAEQILNRIDRKGCWPYDLLRKIFAEYSFKDSCPPDHLSKISGNDKKFLLYHESASKTSSIVIDEIFLADKVDKHLLTRFKAKDDFTKVYQFKITLMETNPPVWRRIQVPENYTFWGLHVAIQDSMGWTDSHLHEFRVKEPRTGREMHLGIPDDEYDDDLHKILPGWEYHIAGEYNKEVLYVYDFGDNWRHVITLEELQTRKKDVRYPLCLDGARACPPEDVGGISGYENFLKIIENPEHEEYKETMEWAVSQIELKDEYQPLKTGNRNRIYDPEHFNPGEIVFDDPYERIKNLLKSGL